MASSPEIYKILHDSRNNRGEFHTHVSMGNNKGTYSFSRDDLEDVFTYCGLRQSSTIGIAEKSPSYSMLRFDFDFEKKSDKLISLYNINIFLNEIIPEIRMYLSKNIVNYNKKNGDCSILTKEPYFKSPNVVKHGIHLQFINVFLSKDDFKQLESDLKQKWEHMDKIASNPWLMYGQTKGNGKKPYLLQYILTHDDILLESEDMDDYLQSYKIYDRKEHRIKYVRDMKFYYPRIFSILPYGRNDMCYELKKKALGDILGSKASNQRWEDCEEEILEYEEDIREIVEEWIADSEDCFQIGTWNNDYLQLRRISSYECPVTKQRDHDSRGAYVYLLKQTGEVRIGCYCNETCEDGKKYRTIGYYKKIKTSIPENVEISEVDLDRECSEYSMIYIPTKGQKFKGYTYGQLCEQEQGFVNWIIDNNVMPHVKIFCKIRKQVWEYTHDLDNIRPQETINKNNIGSYLPRLQKADVVCMRSNMMTFKTENLKELMNHYKRVLMVSFRVSLEDEYMKNFGEYGFKLYSDCKGMITGDRIVCQIDSLWKVMGEFDLCIWDEMVYTMAHLSSFVKKKFQVWNALNDYICNTKKHIVCDALLDNKTIQLFKNHQRSTWVVENQWNSFSTKQVCYIQYDNVAQTIYHIQQNLNKHKKIFIPTNSKAFAEKIFSYFKEIYKVKLDCSDSDPTPSNEWANYDIFITTPSTIAGVSCNDKFGKTIAYFTSQSCNAEMASQMLFRVRNTDCDQIDIFIKQASSRYYPLGKEDIKEWIMDKDNLLLESGLKISHSRGEIVEDDYYRNYVDYIRQQHLSKVCFKSVLKGIMIAHGLEEVSDQEDEIEKANLEEEKEIKLTTKKAHETEKKEERINVSNARELSDEEFKVLDEKYRKTTTEKLSIRKYLITKAYGKRDLNETFIKNFEKLIPKYHNLCSMKCDNLQEWLEDSINKYEKEHKRDENVDRLHEKRHLLKLWTADRIVNILGFENIWDKKSIQEYPYDTARQFLIDHDKKISLLFNTSSQDWSKVTLSVPDEKLITARKKLISQRLNTILKSVCHIGVKKKYKGYVGKTNTEYIISGLEIWEEENIQIKDNIDAVRAKNDKRLQLGFAPRRVPYKTYDRKLNKIVCVN